MYVLFLNPGKNPEYGSAYMKLDKWKKYFCRLYRSPSHPFEDEQIWTPIVTNSNFLIFATFKLLLFHLCLKLQIPAIWVGKYCKYHPFGLENTANTYFMGWKILQIPTLCVGKYCKYLLYANWKILQIPILCVGKYCKYLPYELENTANTYPMGWKILQISTLWVGKYCKYLPYGFKNTVNMASNRISLWLNHCDLKDASSQAKIYDNVADYFFKKLKLTTSALQC